MHFVLDSLEGVRYITSMEATHMNKTESKVIEKLARAMFAEHLYEGLTHKKNYGLVEATRHWNAAKSSPMEFAFIEFEIGTDSNNLVEYLDKHDEHVDRLENLLRELGTLTLSYEELDALAIQRGEN